MSPKRKNQLIQIFFSLTAAEGLVALILLFQVASEESNSWLFGYSRSRILLGGLFLFVTLCFIYLSIRSFVRDTWLEKLREKADQRIHPGDNLLILSTALIGVLLFELFLGILLNSQFSENLHTLGAIFRRSESIFYWFSILSLQVFLLLWLIYYDRFKKKRFYRPQKILQVVMIQSSVLLCGFQWIVFISQDALFTAIPGWYWQYFPKAPSSTDLLFLPILIICIISMRFILHAKNAALRNLLLIMACGYFLQIGFGFIEGEGYESIRKKFMDSGHNQYATHASDDPFLIDIISNYENIYTVNYILGTKPPGGMVLYFASQKLSNVIDQDPSFAGRYARLTKLATFLYPILSILVVVVIYLLAKKSLELENPIHPAVLYIFCPSIILMVLQLDQFLYPLLFSSGILLTEFALKKNSFLLALVTGFLIYLAVFMSFSLLPLASMALIWVAIDTLRRKDASQILHGVKIASGIIVGILVLYFSFLSVMNYDAILRYQNALSWHKTIKIFEPGLKSLANAFLINNIEFVFWTGIPIFLLFLLRSVKGIFALVKGNGKRSDWFLIAFLINFTALNVFGQTRSEVGRLWLFLVPVIVVYAAEELYDLFKGNSKCMVLILISLQLLTTMVTFKFQDFY
jgi:hypothetical protein